MRNQTGAGIVDCKKALEESGDDIDKALDILRKKGIAKASKRMDNEANEGVVKVGVDADGQNGFILEVNCETDFVAKNKDFQKTVDDIFRKMKEASPADIEEVKGLVMSEGTVGEVVDNLSGTIKEKIVLGKYEKISGETVGAYSHMGGKIGVLVSLDKPGEDDLAREIAMQVAAVDPEYIKPEDVPQDKIDKEKSIYREELIKEGKKEEIIDKIIEGKINKYFEEICLINQEYIKDDKQKVSDILGDANVSQMVRYSLGS